MIKLRKKYKLYNLNFLVFLPIILCNILCSCNNPHSAKTEGLHTIDSSHDSNPVILTHEIKEKDQTKTSYDTLKSADYKFPYDLQKPVEKYILPSSLDEISGLGYYKENKLACIQDEKAIIYIFNLDKREVTKKYGFGKDADYEGVEVVGKTAYVLRNNGNLYRIKNFHNKERKIKKFETALSKKNDTEGIGFNPTSNSLLIACKGSPSIEKKYKDKRAIYEFDLEKNSLKSKPFILIDLEDLKDFKGYGYFTKFSIEVSKKLNPAKGDVSFQPSGIAVNPITDNIYVLAHVGKLLIIVNQKSEIIGIQNLDRKIFHQPEGICFSPTGDLFISNEANGAKANILKFEAIKRN